MAEEIIMNVRLDGAQEEIENLANLQESVVELAAAKKELSEQQKELNEEVIAGTTSQEDAAEVSRELTEQQVENNVALKEAKTEYREAEKAVIDNSKANEANSGSLAEMRLELSAAQKEYTQLSKEERENADIGGKLQESIKDQSDELKGLEKDIGITSRSVGDYGSAMEGALPLMGGFGRQIQSVIGTLSGIKTSISGYVASQRAANTATKSTSGGLKLFRVALIATGIGAIVVILGTLISAFLSTQRGIDAVTSVLRPLQEVFQSIFGVIQKLASSGVDKLKKAFSDPKQAVLDLGEAIKKNFIARITGGVKLVKAAGSGFIAAFKLIGLGIKKALSDVPLIGTGIDKVQLEKDLKEASAQVAAAAQLMKEGVVELTLGVDIETAKKAVGEAKEFIEAAAARGQAIDKLTKQIERRAVSLNREVKTGNRLYEVQKALAEDVNIGAKKQLQAAAKAQAILKNTTAIQVAQKDNEIKLAKLKAEANDTDRETQEEIQDLIGEREELEGKAIKKGLLLRNKANSIAAKEESKRLKGIADEEKAVAKGIKDKQKLEIKAIDSKIEALEMARELELALTDETNEIKYQKELELLNKIGALKVDKATKQSEVEAEKITEGIENIKEKEVEKQKIIDEAVGVQKLENQIEQAELEKEQQNLIDEGKKEIEQEQVAFKKKLLSEGISIAAEAGKALLDGAASRAEREKDIELTNLNAKLENGLISQEEFEAKKLAIEKKAFNKKKRLDIASIAIDLAKEISSIAAAAAGNPANALTFGAAGISQALALTGLAVARSGIQAGIVASQKFGSGGIINGPSHLNGGVNLGNNQEGEGGEAIINKRSTAKHMALLSAINQDGGGVSFGGMATPNTGTLSKFANGGITSVVGQSQTIDLTDLESRIASAVGTIQVQNVASETTEVANRVQQIEDSASF